MNATAARILFAIIATIERALRPFGLDVFIERDDSGLGPLAFERRGEEYWGLGLHVIVSRLAC